MKNLFYLFIALLFATATSKAQTTAMDFNRMDCNGNMQHLFADLDSGNVVIIEFFMQNCGSCPIAGDKIEALKADLLAQFPGKIKSYAIGFNNTYSCASNAAWVNSNGFTAVPMDSGAAQVAYYGGMGMPTVVALGGGNAHLVLGEPYLGLTNSDTAAMADDIRDFLNATGIDDSESPVISFTMFPNPSSDEVTLAYEMKETGNISIDVFDITGKNVRSLLNDNIAAGTFKKSFNIASLTAGNYIVRLTANGNSGNHKLNIIR